MRLLVMALVVCSALSGCASDPPCNVDSDCSDGDLCARNAVCLPSSRIRAVHVTWTVQGMAASETTCTGMEGLNIEFRTSSEYKPLGYASVPCAEGAFSVDKLPTAFTVVRMYRGVLSRSATIDATTGEAAFELALVGGTP
jgi:hypothetical protein